MMNYLTRHRLSHLIMVLREIEMDIEMMIITKIITFHLIILGHFGY